MFLKMQPCSNLNEICRMYSCCWNMDVMTVFCWCRSEDDQERCIYANRLWGAERAEWGRHGWRREGHRGRGAQSVRRVWRSGQGLPLQRSDLWRLQRLLQVRVINIYSLNQFMQKHTQPSLTFKHIKVEKFSALKKKRHDMGSFDCWTTFEI